MFNDFFEALKNNNFEEMPVDAKTFVEGEAYLNQPPLSDVQYDIVEAMSQIYREEDLVDILGAEEGHRYYKKYTKNEVILQLGKGSGKDFTSTVACAYIVYKLLCLKDPARYFGKPAGDAIDIINVAINAQQAKNVFFKGFKTKIEKSEWFAGKYNAKAESIEFDKAITVYSGHSERESHEGLNLLLAVLDEISGFASEVATGNEQGKTADNKLKKDHFVALAAVKQNRGALKFVDESIRKDIEGKEQIAEWQYEQQKEEMESAIRLLRMCEDETVNTATYASISQYL